MKILHPILAGNHAILEALERTESDGEVDSSRYHGWSFCSNLSFGPQTVADLRKKSALFFDVHLMLDQPDRYVDAFIKAGSDLISILGT